MKRAIGNWIEGGLTLGAIAQVCGGTLCGTVDDRERVTAVCTDSREAGLGDLFVAIAGEKTDGHAYIPSVMQAGCRAVLCSRYSEEWKGIHAVVVPDPVRALSAVARFYLENYTGLRVAVTGSVGKTTTKEMIAAVLGAKYATFKTEENYNSTVGMPIGALTLPRGTKAAVFEMGMGARGEIADLSAAVLPAIAVITNIGSSHLEKLGSRENIARAKLEIRTGMPEGSCLILDGDEPLLLGEWDADAHKDLRVVRVGTAAPNAYYTTGIRQSETAWQTTFDVQTPRGEWKDLTVQAIGDHMIRDALYAVAVGAEAGLSDQEVRAGLASFASVGLRQMQKTVGGVSLLVDCYNASPESMRASLRVLVSIAHAGGGCAVAVLGDMLELGEHTVALHRELGAFACQIGVDRLYTVGDLGKEIAAGAVAAGFSPEKVRSFDDAGEERLAIELMGNTAFADRLLIKASRGMRAERIVENMQKYVRK